MQQQGGGADSRPILCICCEFALMHEAATAASRQALVESAPSTSYRTDSLNISSEGSRIQMANQMEIRMPRLGDRLVHKEIRSLVKQIEMSMAANRSEVTKPPK